MSDGPHKSLPLRRHWKNFLERVSKKAFSVEDACEVLPVALKKDFREAPLDAVRKILEGAKQAELFLDERIKQLDGLKRSNRGSVEANHVIDCAIAAVVSGLSGSQALSNALEKASEGHVHNTFRSIEEHCQRKANVNEVVYVRGRLDAVRQQFDFKAIAGELMSPIKVPLNAIRLTRHTGLDEGPGLS